MHLKVVCVALVISTLSVTHAIADAPPPQAVAAGFTTPVLIDDFTVNSIGSTWFVFNRDGGVPLTTGRPSSEAFIADGKLTIKTDHSGYGSGLQSINSTLAPTSTHKEPIFHGSRLFRFGYFEARMKFDPKGFKSGRSWPAFWSGSISKAVPRIEIDFMEAQPHDSSVPGSSTILSSTIHEWTSSSNNKANGYTLITPPDDFDPAGFNTYGCLWTDKSITFYINNHIAIMPSATNPTEIGHGTPFQSAVVDSVVIILGTGHQWPTEFAFVHVWQ